MLNFEIFEKAINRVKNYVFKLENKEIEILSFDFYLKCSSVHQDIFGLDEKLEKLKSIFHLYPLQTHEHRSSKLIDLTVPSLDFQEKHISELIELDYRDIEMIKRNDDYVIINDQYSITSIIFDIFMDLPEQKNKIEIAESEVQTIIKITSPTEVFIDEEIHKLVFDEIFFPVYKLRKEFDLFDVINVSNQEAS